MIRGATHFSLTLSLCFSGHSSPNPVLSYSPITILLYNANPVFSNNPAFSTNSVISPQYKELQKDYLKSQPKELHRDICKKLKEDKMAKMIALNDQYKKSIADHLEREQVRDIEIEIERKRKERVSE